MRIGATWRLILIVAGLFPCASGLNAAEEAAESAVPIGELWAIASKEIELEKEFKWWTRAVALPGRLEEGTTVFCLRSLRPDADPGKEENVWWRIEVGSECHVVFANRFAYLPVDTPFPPAIGYVLLIDVASSKVVKKVGARWYEKDIRIVTADGKSGGLKETVLLYDGMMMPQVERKGAAVPEAAGYVVQDANAAAIREHFLDSTPGVRHVRRGLAYGTIRNTAFKDAALWRACEGMKEEREGYVLAQAAVYMEPVAPEERPQEDTGDGGRSQAAAGHVVGLMVVWVDIRHKGGPMQVFIERLLPLPKESISRKAMLEGEPGTERAADALKKIERPVEGAGEAAPR